MEGKKFPHVCSSRLDNGFDGRELTVSQKKKQKSYRASSREREERGVTKFVTGGKLKSCRKNFLLPPPRRKEIKDKFSPQRGCLLWGINVVSFLKPLKKKSNPPTTHTHTVLSHVWKESLRKGAVKNEQSLRDGIFPWREEKQLFGCVENKGKG